MDKVIYTALMGEYDLLKEPKIVTEGWKYICYTNNKELKSDIWEIYYYNFESVKQVRKIKLIIPFECNLSIWIDASIEVNCDLNLFVNKYHRGSFTLMKHPHRNCVYAEADACIQRRKDNSQVILNQINYYRKLRYPSSNGMVATGLLIRDNSEQIKKFCQAWNNEVQTFSKRDQLSFNFTLSRMPIRYNLIPFTILENEFMLHLHHNKKIS